MKKLEYIYNATVLRVVDGDTIEVQIDYGFKLSQVFLVRMAHYNAKEKNEAGGAAATAHLKWLLEDINTATFYPVILKTYKPKEKYGRYLAEVYIDDRYVNQQMLDDGFGEPYEGGPR